MEGNDVDIFLTDVAFYLYHVQKLTFNVLIKKLKHNEFIYGTGAERVNIYFSRYIGQNILSNFQNKSNVTAIDQIVYVRCSANQIIKLQIYLFFINGYIFGNLKMEIPSAIPDSNERKIITL